MLNVIGLITYTLVVAPQTLTVPIEGSLEKSLARRAPQVAPSLASQAARLLGWHGDVARDLRKSDRVRIVYEPKPQPELLALHYRGQRLNLEAYRFDDSEGIARFYDSTAKLVEPSIKRCPVPRYVQITEIVQRGRGKRPHNGVDFKAPKGTPILAPFAGKITRLNWRRRVNGLCVEIALDDGSRARFLHMHSVAKSLRAGQRVEAGARLGTVGSTGRSGAPHLHYEIVSRSGKVLDPLKVHGTYRKMLTKKRRAAFRTARRRYRTLMGLSGDA